MTIVDRYPSTRVSVPLLLMTDTHRSRASVGNAMYYITLRTITDTLVKKGTLFLSSFPVNSVASLLTFSHLRQQFIAGTRKSCRNFDSFRRYRNEASTSGVYYP